MYSDEDDEDVQEEVLEEKTELPKQYVTEGKPDLSPESDPEEVSDDVEIIDDEQLEEEIIDEDEEEISDVDDSELLSRLEAKYGRLPEPDRPGSKHSKHNFVRVFACSYTIANCLKLTKITH